jgi:hypothetical protein
MTWATIIIIVIIGVILGRGIDKIYNVLEEIRDRLPKRFDPDDE